MAQDKIRLAIVDDHQIVIDGLISLLGGQPRYSVELTTTSARFLLDQLRNIPVDVLLTDVMMPEMNGRELAATIRKQHPHIRILALSMSGEGQLVNQMIADADIAGYVLKNIGKSELLHALDKIAEGGLYFSEEVMAEMGKASLIRKENAEVHLTAREIEIIALIEKEFNNKQIADALFISERTVETHRKNIFRKTSTNSVLGLIKYAYEHKLI